LPIKLIIICDNTSVDGTLAKERVYRELKIFAEIYSSHHNLAGCVVMVGFDESWGRRVSVVHHVQQVVVLLNCLGAAQGDRHHLVDLRQKVQINCTDFCHDTNLAHINSVCRQERIVLAPGFASREELDVVQASSAVQDCLVIRHCLQ
jgi:hypothetical protein